MTMTREAAITDKGVAPKSKVKGKGKQLSLLED